MFLRTCLKDYSTCFTLGTNLFLTPWWRFFAQLPFKESLYLSSELRRNPPQSRTNTCDLFGYYSSSGTKNWVDRSVPFGLQSNMGHVCISLPMSNTPVVWKPCFFFKMEIQKCQFWKNIPTEVVVSKVFYFHPYLDLGKWSNLTYIFKMGWNHQLATFS